MGKINRWDRRSNAPQNQILSPGNIEAHAVVRPLPRFVQGRIGINFLLQVVVVVIARFVGIIARKRKVDVETRCGVELSGCV